jgi:uncharacterized membrane protein YdjX (TVP38/TMEM64 family)
MRHSNDQSVGFRRAWRRCKPFLKPLLVVGVLGAGLAVLALSPLREYLSHVEAVRAEVEKWGAWGAAVYVLGAAFLMAFGFPRLVCLPVGGLVFGFWRGLLWTQLATLLGYYATFMFVRWGGRELVEEHFARLRKVHRVFHQHAVPTIVLLRQLPISGVFINVLLGISPITHSDFVIGTLLGTLPEAIPMALLGSSAAHLSRSESVAWVAGALAFVVVVWLFFSWVVRRSPAFAEIQKEYAAEDPVPMNGDQQ